MWITKSSNNTMLPSVNDMMEHCKNLWRNKNIFLNIFDSVIKPLILYSREATKNHFLNDIGKFHVSICKQTLGLSKHAYNLIVLSHLVWIPLSVLVETQMFKVGLSPSKKNCFICFSESRLKMMTKAFYFILKSFFRSQDIYIFVLSFWWCWKNGLIRKIRLISNIYDVTTWLQSNYNKHIAHYFANQRQPDDEIWSGNITRETFFLKYHAENEVARVVTDFLFFLKKLCIRWKQVLCCLVSMYLK